ncbi:MAG TPA: response regulator transcription factor [Vitreimonas sp.]|nr:response regulator transcription factor [Vitreimonas sp.]
MNYSILIVEDDREVREYLRTIMIDQGYKVEVAEDGIQAINKVTQQAPDLMILDLGLPNLSGESVCKEVKKMNLHTQILVLTAKHTTADIVSTLNLGADDYLAKPFELEELLARVKARLRSATSPDTLLSVQDLVLDTQKIQVLRGGEEIKLTPLEFKLLEYLLLNKGKVLTRDMILSRVWSSADIETRVVDVYVGYLRNKIDKGYKNPLIHSVRGFGYMVKD